LLRCPPKPTTTKLLASGDCGYQAGLGALADNFPLKLCHSHQNMHLEPSSGVLVGRVDSLACGDEGNAICVQLSHDLRQVR
jgi:hypothetical protein